MASRSSEIVTPNIFDGRGNCLWGIIRTPRYGTPIAVLYLKKSGVRTGHTGWVTHYEDEVTEIHLSRNAGLCATKTEKSKLSTSQANKQAEDMLRILEVSPAFKHGEMCGFCRL